MQTVNFEKFGLQAGDRVLDLGCGEGRHAVNVYIADNVESFGVDLCHADLVTTHEKYKVFEEPDNANKTFKLSVANALDLPFADNTFDKIICSEVLEHIPDYQSVLKEVNRVLKPGGIFAASVPRFGPEKVCWMLSDEYHGNVGGHVRIFKESELRADIEQLGLSHYHRHWAHALHAPFWWLKCLFWNKQDESLLVKAYHKLLVWDMMDKPRLTRVIEQCLNPFIGKSVVMYFKKGVAA